MIRESATAERQLKTVRHDCDLAVAGGGLAGVCCAITAARAGLKVVLIQDRPVLGGNASSEVRLWVLGATSHMGNNNRWAREGGVIDELLVENLYRNPEGNPVIFDTVILEKVVSEPNITLLLNTAVYELTKKDADTIESLRAFCSQNSTMYEVYAPLFCDASGDGVVGFLAGAAFRMGAESQDEFGEKFAPAREYGELLGHSLYFYTKDVGRPVKFTAPNYALKTITQIPRYRQFSAAEHGCQLWWIEYGGRHDTVHDTENIKWELWKVVYGVWNHIKNSGQFPEAETLTLEWAGTIPGKRESRRFEGDYMLTQRDIIEQRRHDDAVSFGGWAIDLHPADGVFSEKPGCTQWHSKGVYQIPYRCLYSRNIRNLFLAGRIISASHVAFGSTRVMATCAHGGQAVGLAAALCLRGKLLPAQVPVRQLQLELLRRGQYIPHVDVPDESDLARTARAEASSCFALGELKPNGESVPLDVARALLIPVPAGPMPRVTVRIDAKTDGELGAQLRVSEQEGNFTPVVTLATRQVAFTAGKDRILTLDFDVRLDRAQYVFICLMPRAGVRLHLNDMRVTGVLALMHGANRKVAKSAVQQPTEDVGVDTFEFWIPERRPAGQNLACAFDPPVALFGAENVLRGPERPTTQPNAWVAAADDPAPRLTLRWDKVQPIARIELAFDTDFDHPMESVLMGHPERVMPFCVKHYRILDAQGQLLYEQADNHQTRNVVVLPQPIETLALHVEVVETHGTPAAIFRVRAYA